MNSSKGNSVTTDSSHLFAHWRIDFLASLVVFLVALPLCIGIAVAVGVNPARALITGIIGGIVVGTLAGSPLQVSGPAAGLFVILAELLADARTKYIETAEGVTGSHLNDQAMLFALAVMGISVFLAGLLQLAAGWLGLGQWFRAVSPAVIKGMLAGIGVLILASQFHVMLDHQPTWQGEPAHGGLQYIATIPQAIMKCFSPEGTDAHHLAAATGIITIALIVAWPLIAPKRIRILPGALVGVIGATIFATMADLPVIRLLVPDNMFSETTLPSSAWITLLTDPLVLWSAVVICIVASAETLLCATAVDQMHDGPRTRYDKELMAQGVGNTICGLVGALPMTGVIVRSTANVSSGAKTRLSTILHGCWLLLFCVALPWILKYIPRAALGGLLVYTGYKLANPRELRRLWAVGKAEAAIYLVTLVTIVSVDLLVGVMVGFGLSAVKLLHRFSRLNIETLISENRQQASLVLSGTATFLRLPLLAKELELIPEQSEAHIDLYRLLHIDHACLELLKDWSKQHEATGGQVSLDWKAVEVRFDQLVEPADA